MTHIFYDAANSNQVMAYESHPSAEIDAVWEGLGYTKHATDDENELAFVRRHFRNCRLEFTDGKISGSVEAVNPIQPAPDAEAVRRAELAESGKAKLIGLGLSSDEVAALTRSN